MLLPDPAVIWHHESWCCFSEKLKFEHIPDNSHLSVWNWHTFSLSFLLVCFLQSLFPELLDNSIKVECVQRTFMEWCGFDLHASELACLSIFARKILSFHPPCVSGTDCTATCRLRVPKNHEKKERKKRKSFLIIFFWESDPGKQTPAMCVWCQVCVWKRDF